MADHRLQIVLAAKDVTGKAFTRLQGRMTALTKSVFSLKGGFVALAGAYGLKLVASSALDVAASFEQMEVKLDALTKGKGRETLDEINAWALEMPVNTRKAVDTFAMMQAMGLDPTIEKMQTLVDTASIFGEDTMPRVARALGQMATLGRLSAEELNQMSEAGINARKYLTEAFGMTVKEIQKSQISIEEIIDTIWQGLDADFGGAAKKAQDSWQGMVATFKSYMDEILKQVMDAGVFQAIKDQLDTVNQGLKLWIESNEELIKQKVPIYLDQIATAVSGIGKAAGIAYKAWMLLLDTTGIGKLIDAYQQYIELTHEAEAASGGPYFDLNTSDPADFGVITTAIEDQKDTIDRHKTAVSLSAKETERLAEAMAAVYQRQFDVTVESYTQGFIDMADAEAEAAREMAVFQQQVDEMNGIVSDTSTWDVMQQQLKATGDIAKQTGNQLADSMARAFTNVVTGAKDAKDAFADFARSTLNWMTQLLMKQATSSLFSNFTVSAAAQGAVFDQSGIVPFARGGVVNRPAIFPFASGIGLMGEAGPEAILPLTRTSGGDLGVKSDSGGSGTNVFIHAVDAKSFEDMIRRNPAGIIKVVDDAMIGNTSLRNTMRSTL